MLIQVEDYVMIPCRILQHEIWSKPPLYYKVWSYLLFQAQSILSKEGKNGQFFTTISQIQVACSWQVGFRREKPSKQAVHRILKWIQHENERVEEKRWNPLVITIDNQKKGFFVKVDYASRYPCGSEKGWIN